MIPNCSMKTNYAATWQWDFWTLSPESAHQVTVLMGDRGIPKSWWHMTATPATPTLWVNAKGQQRRNKGYRVRPVVSREDRLNLFEVLLRSVGDAERRRRTWRFPIARWMQANRSAAPICRADPNFSVNFR
jgi:Catalase